MVSKLCLSLPLPLGLFALTSCLVTAPSFAQTSDNVSPDFPNPKSKIGVRGQEFPDFVVGASNLSLEKDKEVPSFSVSFSHKVPNLNIDASTQTDEEFRDAGTRRRRDAGTEIGRGLELLTKAPRPIPGDPIKDSDGALNPWTFTPNRLNVTRRTSHSYSPRLEYLRVWASSSVKADFQAVVGSNSLAQLPSLPSSPDIPPLPPDITAPRPTQPLPEASPSPPTPPSDPLLQSSPPVPTAPEPIPGEIPETITVKQFKFTGNTVISNEDLTAAIAKANLLGRELTFAEVFEVRSVITTLYRERGYVTSGAIIPPQTFRNAEGVVEVQIIEGKLESIEVRGTRRLNPDYIRSRVALAAGAPLNQSALIEALQLLQLDPLIKNLSAELTAGTRQGSSLLIVQVEEAKAFSLDLSLNNNRSPTIGTFERRLDATQTNLRGQGDILNVGFSNTNGSNTLDASYTYPLNPRNGTLRFSTSFTLSNVVESPFDRVDIDANSRYFALTFRQPLQRSLSEEFAVGVSLTNQKSKVTIFDVPVRLAPGTEEDGTTTVTALRFFQEWTRQSNRHVFAARSQVTLGLGFLGGTTNEDAPDSNFLAWRGQAQWVSLLAPETLLIVRGDLQFSLDPLLRLEQYGLGGQDTVRGYRQNIFLSDSGMLASAELRFPIARLPRQNALLQVAPFIDFGAIWNNSGNPDPEPDPNFLASVGLGLRFQMGERLSARVDWGIPLINAISSDKTLQEKGLYFSINYSIF